MKKQSLFVLVMILIITTGHLHAAASGIIQNPQEPNNRRTIQMEEIWRVGDDPDEAFVFGVIRGILQDRLGNVYMLDSQLFEVFKFSPDGIYEKSISRNGEGPGEISSCYAFRFWDEETIACLSGYPRSFVRFNLDGIPKDSLKPTSLGGLVGAQMSLNQFQQRDGFLVASGDFHKFEGGTHSQSFFLSAFDNMATETFCYNLSPTGYDFNKPITVNEEADFLPYTRWTLGGNGELFIAPSRNQYRVEVRDFAGNLLRVIARDSKAHKRSKSEKEATKNHYSFSAGGMEIPKISYNISDYDPVLVSLAWISGQLWVSSSDGWRSGIKNGTYVVDVFDPQGQMIEERTYLFPFDKVKDRIHWLDQGRVVVVKNFQSASRASWDNSISIQVGEGSPDLDDEEDSVLEVILYQTVD